MAPNNIVHIPFENEATVPDKMVYCLARAYSTGQPSRIKTREEIIEESRCNADTVKGTLSVLKTNHVVQSLERKEFELVNLKQYKERFANDKGRMITRMLQESGVILSLPAEVVHAALIDVVEEPSKHQEVGHPFQVNEPAPEISFAKAVSIFIAKILRRLLKLIWP